jgi:O-acetylserine/cysteine efflux transporter
VTPRDIAACLVIMVLWGFNFAVAKIGLREFSPILMMALRFALIALVLVPFRPVPAPRRLVGALVLGVLLGGLHFPMMFTGPKQLDAATASVAIQLQVPFSSILAAVVFKDRLGWRRAAGMAVAFAGVLVIAGEPRMADHLGALGLVVAASFVFAVANIHIKRMGPQDGFALNGWTGLFAAPILGAASLVMEQGQTAEILGAGWQGWGAIAYMAFLVTILAYGLWYPLVYRYPVNQTMPWTLTVPVFGVLSGVLVLGEPMTVWLLAGGILTLAGVAVIVLPGPAPASGNPT